MKNLKYIQIEISSEKGVRWIGAIFITFAVICFIFSLLEYYRFKVVSSERFIGLIVMSVFMMMIGVAIVVFATQILMCIKTRCTVESLMSGVALSFCAGMLVVSLIMGSIQGAIMFSILSIFISLFTVWRQRKRAMASNNYVNLEQFDTFVHMNIENENGLKPSDVAKVIDPPGNAENRIPTPSFTVEETDG